MDAFAVFAAVILIIVIIALFFLGWCKYARDHPSGCADSGVSNTIKNAIGNTSIRPRGNYPHPAAASAEAVPATKHKANALVLSCMDYRYISETVDYLYGRNNENDFDYFVLAGASLGYNQSKNGCDASWSKSYEEHIRLALKLHHIEEIIVVDHMDCGYYKAVYGDMVDTPQKEQDKHKMNIHNFIATLKASTEFGALRYTGLLITPNLGGVTFKVVYEEDV